MNWWYHIFFDTYPPHIAPYCQLVPPSPPPNCRRRLWIAPYLKQAKSTDSSQEKTLRIIIIVLFLSLSHLLLHWKSIWSGKQQIKLWDIFQFIFHGHFFQIILHWYFPCYFSFSESFSMIFRFRIDRFSHFFQQETKEMLVGVFAKLV